jgi:hypothetical protein
MDSHQTEPFPIHQEVDKSTFHGKEYRAIHRFLFFFSDVLNVRKTINGVSGLNQD